MLSPQTATRTAAALGKPDIAASDHDILPNQCSLAEARQSHAQILLNKLSLQPSFCGLASAGENPLVS